MDLLTAAKAFSSNPSNVEALTTFMEKLGECMSINELKSILDIDLENVAGPALGRLTDLAPTDLEALLSAAIWSYHYGLDAEAQTYLAKAKAVGPLELNVLQVEIYISYSFGPEYVHALCESALKSFPNDDWLSTTKQSIEKTGELTEMRGPPIHLAWQKAK